MTCLDPKAEMTTVALDTDDGDAEAPPNPVVLEKAPLALRRATTFIDEHAGRDISLDDIAGAVYVTPRALQYMFRKHRDCTPMEYLRNVRLDHANRDLLAADRTTTSVADIARRWHVGHLGRFATNYRLRFDESPHQTLRGERHPIRASVATSRAQPQLNVIPAPPCP